MLHAACTSTCERVSKSTNFHCLRLSDTCVYVCSHVCTNQNHNAAVVFVVVSAARSRPLITARAEKLTCAERSPNIAEATPARLPERINRLLVLARISPPTATHHQCSESSERGRQSSDTPRVCKRRRRRHRRHRRRDASVVIVWVCVVAGGTHKHNKRFWWENARVECGNECKSQRKART